MIFILFYIAVMFLVGIFIALFFADSSSRSLLALLSSAGFSVYIVSVCYGVVRTQRFTWIGLFNLFGLGFVVVHFFFPLLQFFYPEVWELPRVWDYPTIVVKAAAVALSGYSMFCLFYLFFRNRQRTYVRSGWQSNHGDIYRWVSVMLICFALVCFAIVFVVDPGHYLDGAYGYEYREGSSAGVSYLLVAFKMLLLCSIGIDLYRLRQLYARLNIVDFVLKLNRFVAFAVLGFVAMSIYVGDRGPVIQIVFIYAAAYSVFFGRVGLPVFLFAITCGVVLMGFLRFYRTYQRGVEVEEKVEEGRAALQEARWYEIPGELGLSVQVWHAAVNLVDKNGCFYGIFQANNLIGTVPFGLRLLRASSDSELAGANSSDFMTVYILGPDPRWGTGTTIMADLYLDFGIVSSIIGMAFLGFLLAKIERRALVSCSLSGHVLFLLLCGFSLYWPRSSYLPAKEILWAFGLACVVETIIKIVAGQIGLDQDIRKKDAK